MKITLFSIVTVGVLAVALLGCAYPVETVVTAPLFIYSGIKDSIQTAHATPTPYK